MKDKSTNPLFQNTANRLEQIKDAFEENHELISLVFERMPIGICVTDADANFVKVNKAYTEIYGYSKSELIGKPFTKVVPEEGKAELQRLHDEFMGRKYELSGNWQVMNKKGEVFQILTNAAYIKDDETGQAFKMTFVVKLEDAHDAHDQLEVTVKVLESKIEAQESAMSLTEHDIRKNIGTMVTVADIMLKMKPSDQEKKWLSMIKKTGYDTLDLLKATQDFVLMENGTYQANKEVFDLIEVIEKIRSDHQDVINSKNNTFELITPEGHGEEFLIKADLFYFKRMLKNLITNALEAAPEDSTIQVNLILDEDFKIHIHNQGTIPKEIRDNFFEKYITSGKNTGTGLGTYISKMIANIHGGDIDFETSEEKGTLLMIAFPQELIQSTD